MQVSLKQQAVPTLTALLSSSCCVIQLVLNFFSISCAGFAIFTPYRRLLTTVTILMLAYTIRNKGIKNRQVLISTFISVAFMISPEIVKTINVSSTDKVVSSIVFYFRVHLDGLGCEACANRIKNRLNAVEWILDTRVYFDNSTAIVQTITRIVDHSITDLIKSIDTKYDAQVLDSWVGYTK
ncbi:hypothetical protein BDF21DRAFT_420072 [Thamnidium elegans]|uniref:HMA domain-containing protein n=1 Tax=Thamnidium elegans TaxID=101142 RepID=A0A8H7VWQ7_9FUNG|nr:hypothetical protein INT48_008670 [Thamnidium elegans]KAI8079427.1 hypothetical protein BDF21DRAFT_420072 [Thamnidium elegans]